MKIRTLYHFEYVAEDDFEFDIPVDWQYRLISRSGENGHIDSLSWTYFRVDLFRIEAEDGVVFGLSSEIPIKLGELKEINHFHFQTPTIAKFTIYNDIILHFDSINNSVDVCYMEECDVPIDTDWEQGLESSLDLQIRQLRDKATNCYQRRIRWGNQFK